MSEAVLPDKDVIVRLSTGTIVRLEKGWSLDALAEAIRKRAGIARDERGVLVVLDHVVEAWEVDPGSPVYSGIT